MSYFEDCKESLLPISSANLLTAAFKEWVFTGEVRDRKMEGECHLCGYHPLRWHYKIQSKETEETLWVGSECIKNFAQKRANCRGRDGENAREQMHNSLREARKDFRKQKVISALRELWSEEERGDFQPTITSIAEQIKRYDKISPEQAKLLTWRADEAEVDLPLDFMDVNLRKKKYKRQMNEIPDWQIKQFWDSFSSQQKKRALKRGWIDSVS
jgi:hypothetical protein